MDLNFFKTSKTRLRKTKSTFSLVDCSSGALRFGLAFGPQKGGGSWYLTNLSFLDTGKQSFLIFKNELVN